METRAPLFGKEHREDLFAPKEAEIDSSIAMNRAYTESQVLGDSESIEARRLVQSQANVEDETIGRLWETLQNDQSDLLDRLNEPNLSREDRFEITKAEIDRREAGALSSRDTLLFHTYSSGGGAIPNQIFQETYREQGPNVVDFIRRQSMEQQWARGRREVDDLVAGYGFDSYGEMFANVAQQDFAPVLNVVSRLGLNRALLEAATGKPVNGFSNFFTGEIRQKIRTTLKEMGPQERTQAVKDMTAEVRRLEKDPQYGPLLTKYNVLESMEAIFTEDLMTKGDDKNTFDRILGNVDIALETLFTVGAIARFGSKTVRGATRATDAVRARQIARATRRHDLAAQLDASLQDDALAAQFRIEPDEAIPTLLPKPVKLVDDIDILPQGNKDVLFRSERIASEILETTDNLTGRGLNAEDKANVTRKAIEDIDLSDGMEVMPRMSTIRPLANDTGIQIDAVIGRTAEGGWDDINEAVNDLLQLDPNLERFELVRATEDGVLGGVFASKDDFLRAAFKGEFPISAAPNQSGLVPEYYLRYKQDRFWHTVDKESFGPETFLNTGRTPRALLPPNAKFGDEIYGSFLRAYMDEQQTIRNFDLLFTPYYKMGIEDKKFVSSAFEWMEDFGKENARAPDLSEIISEFDGINEAQINGIIALRTGMDTMHELFNRRLYRDWDALNFKTARPQNATLPTYHGKVFERADVPSGQYLDPITGKMVSITARELDDVYNAGGRIMKLDMAVDAANESRAKADLVLLSDEAYEVGELSTRPMIYHPGYSLRFYDDPYYIVKETNGISLNGSVRRGSSSISSEAIKTAGTQFEADNFIRRANFRTQRRGEQGVTFKVVRARDISSTESTLLQKQTLHREGRLFWDERNFDRLPDVNGNRAKLADPVKSIERGVAMAARQATHEDLMKSMKGAFENEYADLVDRGAFENKSMQEIVDDLTARRRNTTDPTLKNRLNEGIELVKYFRLMSGTESRAIPMMREGALSLAATLGRTTGGRLSSKGVEKYLQTLDPFRTMRSVAFNVFMTFRPVRQLLLQSLQIAYLAPLKPGYVASGKMFVDSFGLRRGLTALRKSGFEDGFSVGSAAKAMGLSKREYRKLIKEFDRSGLLDLVDVHSFSGGARRTNKIALPNSPTGVIGYKAKQITAGTREWFQRVGFDFGEKNNITFTYALALKRFMDDNAIKSVLDINVNQWDELRVEASNLALGMVRPNNFGYQSGALSVATQFLSFSHKAMLGIIGKNPALKGLDAAKIAFGTYLMFGSNMFGARDFVETQLKLMGVDDAEIPGIEGGTLVDLLSAGIIETGFNELGDLTADDWKDMDLAPFAPGFDFTRMWEMQIETLASQPSKVVFGPFGNVFSKTMQSFEFVNWYMQGNPDSDPADKFIVAADAITRGVFPQYNDLVMSYMGYQMNQWFSTSGEALPLRPTMNSLLGRAAFGARTREELGYYRLQNEKWESEEFYRDVVRENKKFLVLTINRWRDGTYNDTEVREAVQMLTNLMDEFPEGRRQQVLESSLLEDLDNGNPSVHKQLVQMMKEKQFTPETSTIIDLFVDIPVEKREKLKEFGLETWQRRLDTDAEAESRLRERN